MLIPKLLASDKTPKELKSSSIKGRVITVRGGGGGGGGEKGHYFGGRVIIFFPLVWGEGHNFFKVF